MTQEEKRLLEELNDLLTGYAIRSACTNMPYVKCSPTTVNDQVFLFEKQEDAEAFCAAEKAAGIPVTVQKLEAQPIEGDPEGRVVSMVRQFLATLMMLDVDVVCYRSAAMAEGKEIYVSDLMPEGLAKKMFNSKAYNPLLQLTGIFFCQAARLPKERQDPEEIKLAEEEFAANLVKSELLIAVLPPEDMEASGGKGSVKLSECRYPSVKDPAGQVFMPVFTDLHELQKFAGQKRLAAMKVNFLRLHNYFLKEASGYMLNPAGFALPFKREQMGAMAARFGLQLETLPKPAK
ncbi:MAG: SseB family protein [Oscillospiraceae bacterium]|nr:SseB family protein [Oscillospiraceae bacterium]